MEKNKEILKNIICEDKGILPTTSTTSTTFTTSINNWGYINLKESILLEQISKKQYLYNLKGKKGVAQVKFQCSSCGNLLYLEQDKTKIRCSCGKSLTLEDQGVFIGDHSFKLNSMPKDPLYLVPDIEKIKEVLFDSRKIPKTEELFREIENCLLTLFEFQNKEEAKICAIFVLFSYLLPHFDASFYLGIDATKGSGKTTLLEIISILSRHGFLADVSPASIPRLKQKYDLAIFIDEIDQLRNGEDIEGLLRKGQRRGNKYVRLNKNSLDEEIYEAFGVYGYSFRSSVEDAFRQRSILMRTPKAKDNRLSVINLVKTDLLKPLLNKIFLWYVENIFVFGSSRSSEVVQVVGGFTPDHNHLRSKIYDDLTEKFTKEEKDLIKTLFGRNSEIGYLFIKLSKFIGLDLLKEIKKTMLLKQEEEETPDNYYFDLMKTIFEKNIKNNSNWLLQKGEFTGCMYFPKMKFYYLLVSQLKENNLMGIGTPKFNSLLKDVGFVKNFNIKNQKEKGNANPILSLIFEKDVLKKLNIDYTQQIEVPRVKIGKKNDKI